MPSLKKVKLKTWDFYCKWREEETFCPAFNENVQISLKGWYHLIGGDKSRRRIASDVYRRLMLLPYAKEIIRKSSTIQNVTVKNNKKYYALEAVVKINELPTKPLRKVRVIFIEGSNNKKIFLSVMDRKIII